MRVIEGSQVAFVLGLLSATLGVGISTILGTIAAFFGGRVDAYLMRQSDLILMLPSLPLLFIISAFAELKVWHLAVVLGVLGGLGGSVITIKSQALQVKVKPFVDSARITGGSRWRIMFSHVLPNVAPLALLFMVFSSVETQLFIRVVQVSVGRDMGSVVFPNSRNKIYLDSSKKLRSKRRMSQSNNIETEEDIAHRDQRDSNREHSPLIIPDGAIVIENNDVTINEVLDKLKKKNYECYVLSNWSAETFVGMTDDYPFLQSFDGLLISGEDKMMKPNAEIYELAITRFNLIPQETVFIDDKLENIEAAKKLNLKTIHLVDPNKIELEIDKYLV